MLPRPLARALLVLGIIGLAACDDSTSPDPVSSNLTVQVYIDANGDGTLGAGDDPIDGAQVSGTSADGVGISLTTGADGTATTTVEPGTYTLSLVSGAPAGATLTTASNPVVLAQFYGDNLTAEFRFAFEPGGIAGTLYRDDDESGDYTPGVDTPAPGVPVALIPGGASEASASTTTGEDGSYTFAGLRPGSYQVTFDPPETIELVGGNTLSVSVAPQATTTADAAFTGSLLVDIAAAREASQGSLVTVEGTVTWQAQWDNRVIYFQDATGGLNAFYGDAPELNAGDLIQVTGTMGAFRGETQISPTNLTVIDSGEVPAARLVTGAEINAGQFQGELVTLSATVVEVEVLSFDNQAVTLADPAGVEFSVYSDSRTGVEPANWPAVGEAVTVTGVLATDDRNDPAPQLEVRSPDDVAAGGDPTPIADARALPEGEPVIVEGVVTWQINWSGGNLYFYQDETGGMLSFHNNESVEIPTLNRGDRIRVSGIRSSFRSEIQISPVNGVQIIGSEAEPLPRLVSGADINAGRFQAELATLIGTVTEVEVLSFDNQAVTLTDAAGTTFSVYVDSRNGVTPDAWTVGETYQVTGVLGTDDRQDLPYRLEPRDINDIAVDESGAVSIADARSQPGATVTVVGTVTWQNQWDTRVFFFQDATGGLSAFYGDAPELNEGDVIQVTGEIGAFRGETQISPTSLEIVGSGSVDPLAVTGAEINAGDFQGQLVTLSAQVVEVEVLSFDNQAVTLEDGAGTQFSVYSDSRTGVLPDAWPEVGQQVQVTGVLGTDDRNDPAPRIEVRSPEDIQDPSAILRTLAEARGLDGQTVTVEGTVTWQAGWDTRIFFFQDATAGISVFYGDAPELNVGDRVRIVGEIGAFRGEVQLSPTSVTVTGSGPAPTPLEVTGADINAGLNQGELVTLAATVVEVEVLSFDNQAVTLEDGAGTQFSVYSDSRTGVLPDAWPGVGEAVTVTGVLGTDDRNDPAPRLEVRGPEDVVVPEGPTVTDLATARGLAGETVTVEGTVAWQNQWDTRVFFFQDATGGISAFYGDAPELNIGDRIRVTGSIGAFRGEVQLSPTELTVLESGDPPSPRTVTGAEINAGQFQGELVTVAATVVEVEVLSFDNQAVTLEDGAGTQFSVYSDSRTGVLPDAWPGVGQAVTVTGVLGTDDRNDPAPRLEVRSPEDVVTPAPSPALAAAGGR